MNHTKTFLSLCLCLLLIARVQAQGCSDAGFCTMGAMKPDQLFRKQRSLKLRSIELSQHVARTTFNDAIIVTNFDANIGLSSKYILQVKVPYTVVSSVLGTTHGFGDLSLALTREVRGNEKSQFQLTLGAKIPTNDANKQTADGLPLPMYLQTSLGTFDAVFGISWLQRNWLIATGIQHPLASINRNDFLWEKWAGSPLFDMVNSRYYQSRQVRRGSDVMIRVERSWRFSRLSFSAGLLNIYRYSPDYITRVVSGNDTQVQAAGTVGWAITAIYMVGYRFSPQSSLRFTFGDKLTNRVRNPDGLSRLQVYQLGFMYNF